MDAPQAKIQSCETIIGYTFKNKTLLYEAIQTAGIGVVPKNTRLAVYGDSALNKELCRMWYNMDLSKGESTLCHGSTLCLSF